MKLSFYNDVRSIKGHRGTRGRELWSKRNRLLAYVGNIIFKPRFEQLKIGESPSCESVPQNSGLFEEAAWVKVTSHEWNTKLQTEKKNSNHEKKKAMGFKSKL